MALRPLTRSARVISWQLFLLVTISASYFYQSSGHNEAGRFDQLRSTMEHGEWWIDRFAINTNDVVQAGGHTYPNKAPGPTLLGALPWKGTRAVLRLLPVDEKQQLILTTWAITILMSAVPTGLICLMMFRFLARNGWTNTQGVLLSGGYGLGSIAFPWATTFFSHQLAAFFGFGAFYLVWTCQFVEGRPRTARLILAGLLMGFLPVIEYPGAIATGLIGLYAVAALGLRVSVPLILATILGMLPLPAYNLIAFSDPTVVGYSFLAHENSKVPGHRFGLMGVSWPRLEALHYITLGPPRGLFYANPWLAFALLAPLFGRRMSGLRRELILFAGIFACFLAFNSGFGRTPGFWGGGFSLGPRYILIAVPFVALLAAFPMRSRFLGPLIGLLIMGTTPLMLAAAAVDPRLPYEPADPFLTFYLPLYSRGLFSIMPWSTFTESTIFGSSGAFNLGRAAGLPRDLEILPLTILWAVGFMFVIKGSTRTARFTQRVAAVLIVAFGLWPAWPRLSPWNLREPGLCETISPNQTWLYLQDHPLQPEPGSEPLRRRVASPLIAPDQPEGAFDLSRYPQVAVTFSGHFEPEIGGWHTFRAGVIGSAALYVDGLSRLKLQGSGPSPTQGQSRVYLSKGRHEIVLRYMAREADRWLHVTIAEGDGPPFPFQTGLSSGNCG